MPFVRNLEQLFSEIFFQPTSGTSLCDEDWHVRWLLPNWFKPLQYSKNLPPVSQPLPYFPANRLVHIPTIVLHCNIKYRVHGKYLHMLLFTPKPTSPKPSQNHFNQTWCWWRPPHVWPYQLHVNLTYTIPTQGCLPILTCLSMIFLVPQNDFSISAIKSGVKYYTSYTKYSDPLMSFIIHPENRWSCWRSSTYGNEFVPPDRHSLTG